MPVLRVMEFLFEFLHIPYFNFWEEDFIQDIEVFVFCYNVFTISSKCTIHKGIVIGIIWN